MSSTRWKATLAGASVFTLLVYFNYANSPWNGPKSKTLRAPAIAQKRRLKGDIYSGHNCVAGSTSGPGQDQTRCIFKNVCLTLDTLIEPSSGIVPDRPKGFVQPSSVRMKYFRPRIAREAPLYWYDEFSLESSWVRIDRDSALTPELVYEPLPNNEEVTWWSPAPVTVLTEAFWPENYGHALGDDFLPIYRLAKSFGLWDRKELGVIFHPDCSKRGGFDRGCENHRRMSELLLDRPIVTASSSIWPEDGSPLCFEKLLVGTRLLGMGMPSEGSWTGFIGEIKSHLGIDPDHQPTKQKITIFDKRGRRTILNPVELKERLEERFQIQVDIINPAAFSLEQQAGMFEDTTVLVSPCGGVSFSSVFLPKGASTIFLDYWNAKWNSTAQMERHIYSWMSDMTPYYYPLELSDLSWNLAAIPLQIHDNESELMRSWVNVTINLDRMERYVLAALIQAEVTLGLSGTFKLEPDGFSFVQDPRDVGMRHATFRLLLSTLAFSLVQASPESLPRSVIANPKASNAESISGRVGGYAGAATKREERYDEELSLRTLPDGKLLNRFVFRMSGPEREDSSLNARKNYEKLPAKLLEIIDEFDVEEFHLTLSSGRWQDSYHQSIPSTLHLAGGDGEGAGGRRGRGRGNVIPPSGIELYAWLAPSPLRYAGTMEEMTTREMRVIEEEEAERWRNFKGAIAGLFCAGIGNAPEDNSAEGVPSWSFSPDGLVDPETIFHSLHLPALSATCTESLTPFLSLLPCASYAGIGELINSHKVFDGVWTEIGVHYSIQSGNDAGVGVRTDGEELERREVRLELGSILDPVRAERLAGGQGRRDFSFESLFDRSIKRACPVASSSLVKLVLPTDSIEPFAIEPSRGRRVEKSEEGVDELVWDTSILGDAIGKDGLDVAMKWETEFKFKYPSPVSILPPPISVRRILKGVGQERGSIGIEITNHDDAPEGVRVIWSEIWPWWLRAFMGTLTEREIGGASSRNATIKFLDYTPPLPRKRPTTLQVLLELPPKSTWRYMLEFENGYLWYTEYPADPSRGSELAGARLVLLNSPSPSSAHPNPKFNDGPELLLRRLVARLIVHTTTTLISIPTPDFSMPYNVIILTSTLIALFFGSFVNFFVRDWWVVDLTTGGGEEKVDGEGEVVEGEGEVDEVRKEKRRRIVVD